jgi:hypothetical protein
VLLQLRIEIDESFVQQPRQAAANGSFTRPHETGQIDVHEDVLGAFKVFFAAGS